MNDYFTFFYVKHFELPLCMKCAIQINLPCLALYNFGYGQLTIYRSFLILGSRHALRTTTCHSNRIKVNTFFCGFIPFPPGLAHRRYTVQLNPGPGLVDTCVDNATGLLPHRRVEFPALDTTGPFNSTPPGVPIGFQTEPGTALDNKPGLNPGPLS